MVQHLNLTGTPKEIGFIHGERGKKEVHQSLETYEKLFRGYQKIDWNEAKERAKAHLDAIEAYDFTMLEEMDGIAQGAGVDFEDILALNTRSEIALTGYKGMAFSDGCTVLATTNPISQDTLLAQNWDWKGSQKDSLLIVTIEQQDRPKITMITEGGLIGKIGFNDAGVGVCFNALHSDKKSDAVPIHLGLRGVLNSQNLGEAVSRIKHGQMACAASFMVAYDDGKVGGLAVNAEVSPFGMDFVGGNTGSLVHTNHILSNELKKNLMDMNEFIFDDSTLRKLRAEQLIQQSISAKESIDEQVIERWLKDTYNEPNAINHRVNPFAPEHRQMETVFSIIMNLSKRTATYRIGNSTTEKFNSL